MIQAMDRSVYPDVETPVQLVDEYDRADYVARICGAWDFDLLPTRETFIMLRGWRDVFDRFPLPDSPAYAAFRTIFGWPPIRGGSILAADHERYAFGGLRRP